MTMQNKPVSKAEIARLLGITRANITLLSKGKRKLINELKEKIEMLLVNKQLDHSDLKSASLTGVWVQVPPSALTPFQSKSVNRISYDFD
jgi:predicted transcriptional regulator